jgi:hypothetical protein
MKITRECSSSSLKQLSLLLNPDWHTACSWLGSQARKDLIPLSRCRARSQGQSSDDCMWTSVIQPSSPSSQPFWHSATLKAHPHREGHSRETVWVGPRWGQL